MAPAHSILRRVTDGLLGAPDLDLGFTRGTPAEFERAMGAAIAIASERLEAKSAQTLPKAFTFRLLTKSTAGPARISPDVMAARTRPEFKPYLGLARVLETIIEKAEPSGPRGEEPRDLGIRLRDAEVESAHELLAAEEWLRLYLVDVLKIKPGHTERLIAGL